MKYHRRSFACTEAMWEKITKVTNNCVSISQFIRQAISEKLGKEDHNYISSNESKNKDF